MKKLLLLTTLLGVLVSTACSTTSSESPNSSSSVEEQTTEQVTTSSESTTEESSSLENTTSSEEPSSSEESTSSEQPEELAMTLQVSKDAESDGTYKLKIGEEMTVTPVFNISNHEEEVKYEATESGFFGSSPSTNVTITNGVVKATGKASKITLTVTSLTNNLVQTLTISTYAELDSYDSDIKAKLDAALTEEEKLLSSASYMSESKTSSDTYDVTILESGVEYTQTNVNGSNTTEYYVYNGMYNGKYHSYKNNLTNNKVETISSKDTAPSSLTLFNVKTNSFNSSMGISAAVKYYYTYYFTMTAYDYASVKLNENSYSIISKYNTDNLGTKTHTELKLDIIFEDTKLVSFEFERNEYDAANYDFDNNTLISGATSTSYTHVSSQLIYGERVNSSTTYNPQEFYFTSYDVVLTDDKGNVGTTFQAGSILTYNYGENFEPSTALKEFDKLSFVSSSDTNVVNVTDNGEIKCLAAGKSTLKFVTTGGVEKEVEVTVEGEIVKLTDEEIASILESKEWIYEKDNLSGGKDKAASLTFVDGKGTFTLISNDAIMTFDYSVVDGVLSLSNLSSSSTSYSIVEISFNENINEITVKYSQKSAWGGTYTYPCTLK